MSEAIVKPTERIFHQNDQFQDVPATVEPRFNEPLSLYDRVLGVTNNIFQPGQSFSEMFGTEPRYNEPRYNEMLVIMNKIEKPKRKIYPNITSKCHQATKDECETDQQR